MTILKNFTGLLPTPTGTDYKSRGPNSKQVGIDNFFKIYNQEILKMRTSSRSVLNQASIPSFSPQDVPASRQVVPGSDEARKMTVGSGMRLLEFSKSPIQLGQSLKMLRDYLVLKGEWYSTICLLNWKERVTKSGRLLFQLAPSTPRTEGTGCGLLGTPRVVQSERSEEFAKGRVPTPQEALNQIAMLPTPATRDWKDSFNTVPDSIGKTRGFSLGQKFADVNVNHPENGTNRGLKLQPAFVEWMMGYQEGWTELID